MVLFGLVWVLLPFNVASWQGDIEKVKSCKVHLKYERSALTFNLFTSEECKTKVVQTWGKLMFIIVYNDKNVCRAYL